VSDKSDSHPVKENANAANASENKQYDSPSKSIPENTPEVVSLENAARVAVTAVALILLGPIAGICVGAVALVDAKLDGKLSSKVKDAFSCKDEQANSKGDTDENKKHTTFLGNAARVGLTAAAFLLLGPIGGIITGALAFMDYKSDGKLCEAGKNIVVNSSKDIKGTISKAHNWIKEQMQEPAGYHTEKETETQKHQQENRKTDRQERIQLEREEPEVHTTRVMDRRNYVENQGIGR
jgi:hypothetical protein